MKAIYLSFPITVKQALGVTTDDVLYYFELKIIDMIKMP